MRKLYFDLMEKVLEAYSLEHIRRYTDTVLKNGLEEHGFPRLTANIGILISHGRKTELKDDFIKMMDLCCSEIPVALGINGINVGNDFSVKEIVFCLLEVEKARIVEKEITEQWREKLAKINPYTTYSKIASVPPKPIDNWAAFGAASEQVRKYAGIGDESVFIEDQMKALLLCFDENGMFCDPGNPIVYDLVTRLQFAIALYFGFEGESRDALEENLLKSADMTLKMQSVTGELPFGGRSIQFLHNETLFTALCEYYAGVFKQKGDLDKAGQFKSAAKRAVESILPWLQEKPIRHIRNYYEVDSGFGCEGYAYYDKYMITVASWLYMAYMMADDAIEEVDFLERENAYICETSDSFHKVFCRFGDYFVELDTRASSIYDASGVGRIHKKGSPSTICMSVPFCKNPKYKIDISNPSYLSISGAIKKHGEWIYTYDYKTEYQLIEKHITAQLVQVKFACKMEEDIVCYQTCTVSEDGVEICFEGPGELKLMFPLFDYDGKQQVSNSLSENSAEVIYKGYKCQYTSEDKMVLTEDVYANRNGHYKAAAVCGKDSISLKVAITKDIQY